MKAIKMRIQKFSRPGVIFLAAVVVIITSMVAANATQTITAPNAAFISYNLAAGANSTAITPVASKSLLVMGCSTGINQGVGQASLQHIPTGFMVWAGLESPTSASGGAAITSGAGSAAGTHIVYIDFFHKVDIQVASGNTIQIHNGDVGTRAGNVTLIW